MITYLEMIVVVAFLAAIIFPKIKIENSDSQHLFDIQNTTALRGFWCIVIILVHIPIGYQNVVQDLIGSFAYIGVTYFFMTSAYGLRKSAEGTGQLTGFWKRRLPKLLIPHFIVNILSAIVSILQGKCISLLTIVQISHWVRWLLVCYVVFYVVENAEAIKSRCKTFVISLLVIAFSITMYTLSKCGVVKQTTWCPEIYGFIWGLLFVTYRKNFIAFAQRKWLPKVFVSTCISLIAGISYLKFKHCFVVGDYALKIFLGLSILIWILLLNSKIVFGNKLNQFLGKISYEVYLLHGLVMQVLSPLGLSSGMFIILTIIGTIAIAAVTNRISYYILAAMRK